MISGAKVKEKKKIQMSSFGVPFLQDESNLRNGVVGGYLMRMMSV